jgi:hypothetical protein
MEASGETREHEKFPVPVFFFTVRRGLVDEVDQSEAVQVRWLLCVPIRRIQATWPAGCAGFNWQF